jgi:hypothetical protein
LQIQTRSCRSNATRSTSSPYQVLVTTKFVDNNFNSIANNLLLVKEKIHDSSTDLGKLPHHDIFGDTSEDLLLTVGRCVHEHVNSFFEGATQQRS